jgi:hypothetical protein
MDIYDDVCQWKESLQLVPMITNYLVPLGIKWEKAKKQKCNGFGDRSIQELMPASERDVALCGASAGIVPCHLIDFHDVTTAMQFYWKLVALYQQHLKNHCNFEWQRHFKALLDRLRDSLTCEGGLAPSDHGHPGGSNSENEHNGHVLCADGSYRVTCPTVTPKPPQPPTGGGGYIPVPGPANSRGYCPWNAANFDGSAYNPDCGNGMCNLKFAEKCLNNLFNIVYKDICKWQESLQLVPMLMPWFTKLGINWEKRHGKCNRNSNGGQRGLIFGDYEQEIEDSRKYDVTGDAVVYFDDILMQGRIDQGRLIEGNSRDIPTCDANAGVVPCDFLNFHSVNDEWDFYWKMEKLHEIVGAQCNNEWNVHVTALLKRLKLSITCPNGEEPDHVTTKKPPTGFTYAPTESPPPRAVTAYGGRPGRGG